MQAINAINNNVIYPSASIPFHVALENLSPEIIQNMIEQMHDLRAVDAQNYTPLERCLHKERLDIALFILKTQITKNAQTPHYSYEELRALMQLIQKHKDSLFVNVEHDLVGQLILAAVEQKIVSVDDAFIIALEIDNTKAASPLLETSKADPNISNADGDSPLHLAIENANLDLVILLLKNSANPNTPDFEGKTPLYRAVEMESPLLASLLLEYKADPNIADEEGITPLHVAVDLGSMELTNLLLTHNANPNIFNGFDEGTPLDLAIYTQRADLVLKLYESGAHISPKTAFKALVLLYTLPQTLDVNCLLAFYKQGCFLSLTSLHLCFHIHELSSLLFCEKGLQMLQNTNMVNTPLTLDGLTPVHIAILSGSTSTIDRLLNLGGNLEATCTEFQLSALHLATTIVSQEGRLIQYLLRKCPALLHKKHLNNETAWEAVVRLHFHLLPIFVECCTPEDLIPAVQNEKVAVAEPYPLIDGTVVRLADSYGVIQYYDLSSDDYLSLEISRVQKYTLLCTFYLELLKNHQPFKDNFQRIVQEFQNFSTLQTLSEKWVHEINNHRPYMSYLQNVSYQKIFEEKIVAIKSILESNAFYHSLASLIDTHLSTQNKTALFQIKEALFVLNAMHANFNVSEQHKKAFFALFEKLSTTLQMFVSRESAQKQNLMTTFDEMDGAQFIANLLSTYPNKEVTDYCQAAFKAGLIEGRDLRAVGIDDTIAILSLLTNAGTEQPDLQFLNTIEKKRALLQQLQQKGFLQSVACPDPCTEVWEQLFNKELLLLILSKQEALQQLLESQSVESVSKLQNFDLLTFLNC